MKAVRTLLLNRILLTVVACGVAGFASSVWAAPIIDGNVGGGEYSVVLNDTAPETTADFFNSGLDIQALHFDNSGSSYWLGLAVVSAPIDTNGDPTSFLFETIFDLVFFDNSGTTPAYLVTVEMNGTLAVELAEWSGGSWSTVALVGSDFDVSVVNGLELRINQSKMGSLAANPYVRAQLDGVGSWDDDQLFGVVPEPATMAMLVLGGAGLFLTKRRRG